MWSVNALRLEWCYDTGNDKNIIIIRRGRASRWPEASQKAVGPARAILWLARLASHNFSQVLSVFVFISVNNFSNKCSLTR